MGTRLVPASAIVSTTVDRRAASLRHDRPDRRPAAWTTLLMSLVAAMLIGCSIRPSTIDVVVANRSGESVIFRLATEDQAGEVWLRLDDGTRTTIRDWPVLGRHSTALVVDSSCGVLTPNPWGAIPTSSGDSEPYWVPWRLG